MSEPKRKVDILSDAIRPLQFEENRASLQLLDVMRSVILYVDLGGMITGGNQCAGQLFDIDKFKGKPFNTLACLWDRPSKRYAELMHTINSGVPHTASTESLHVDGEELWYNVDKVPILNQQGDVSGALIIMNDITESIKRGRALRTSHDRYKAVIANSTDAIWCYDIVPPINIQSTNEQQVEELIERAILIEANERLVEIVGAKSIHSLVGLPLKASGALCDKTLITAFVKNAYRLAEFEFQRIHIKNRHTTMVCSAMGIVETGCLTKVWGTTRDVTNDKQYVDKLEYLANHDTLTSLPNRAQLYKYMRRAFSEQNHYQQMSLLLIDLDRFKEINDTLGHLAGDKVLKQLGPRLEVELADTPGMVARLGGDEFAIFLPKIRNQQHAVVMAHRFLDALCQVFEVEGFQTEISASIGISLSPDHAQDATTLLRYADVAMYHAKNSLKGIAVYDAQFDTHTPKRLALIGALGSAIRENQFYLQYQPKVCLKTHKVFGFEALIRWQHPNMGVIPPSDFVPIAEMSSFIYAMSSWVLEQTIQQCAQWRAGGYDTVCAMNLSARNLLDDRIVVDLARLLKKYELPGDRLEIEITESTLMSDPERALRALEKIDTLGVKLSIDDFGTGYSSLAYLKRLPVDTLKIDGSFIQGMLDDDQDEIIVNSTIQLAHNLGLSIVAEGVEKVEVYQRLVDLGCDNVQGYYVSRPLDSSSVLDWVSAAKW